MNGLKFDFDTNDLRLSNNKFETADIDNQNVALIALSQVCRITRPEIGAQVGSRIINQPAGRASVALGEAQRMAERDGATDVSITLTDDNKLYFSGKYESNI